MWTLTACHRLEGQNFPFSRIVLRSWHNCGAAAALTVLEAQSFLGGTKIKFKAPLGRVINFKFQKAPFIVVLMLLPVLVLDGQAAVRGTRGLAWTAARLPLR